MHVNKHVSLDLWMHVNKHVWCYSFGGHCHQPHFPQHIRVNDICGEPHVEYTHFVDNFCYDCSDCSEHHIFLHVFIVVVMKH